MMKRPTMLLWRVLLDVGPQSLDSIKRDFQEIESRYQREGLSFLTITLPRLDDALTKALSIGRLARDMFEGFAPRTRRGSLPALLQGFFRRIFDDDGWLLPKPDTDAIFAIRQVTRLFKKVELPCSQRRINAAYERYISNDQEMEWDRHANVIDNSLWASISGILWSGLENLSGELYCHPGIFGSGATAEKYKRNERLSVRTWPDRAEWLFPAAAHAVSREDSEDLNTITWIPPEREESVRVVQVPKTLKTPRTISVEPSYMMLMQQSIARPLMSYLESKRFGFQSIRFRDQSPNRTLAHLGSVDGRLATIDLSDASDLVSLQLVRSTFKRCAPTFLEMIEGCRTRTAKLPGGETIELKKFASMGSALCFPIESMIFFTIVMYAIVRATGRRPSRHYLRSIANSVAIYGDDIIVESRWAPVVMETLASLGLRVNQDKSFHTGLFRESCGGDYYNGVDVTPAYVRQWSDTGTVPRDLLIDYVSLSNQFYMKGLWHACQSIRDLIGSRTRIPHSRYPIGVLHYTSFLYSSNLQWDSDIQGFRVKGYGVRARDQADPVQTISGGMFGVFHGSNHGSPQGHSPGNPLEQPGTTLSDRVGVSTNGCEDCAGPDRVPFSRNCETGLHQCLRGRSTRVVYGYGVIGKRQMSYYDILNNPAYRVGTISRQIDLSVKTSQSRRGATSVRPYSRSLKSRWCLSPEVVQA